MDAFRICCFLVLHQISLLYAAITCRNQAGEPVDWFVVYKLPKIYEASSSDINNGVGFYYMDVDNLKWTLGGNINETKHSVYHTLQQIYENRGSKDVMYLIYNDETPEKHVSYSNGHTKGDVVFDKTSGFWLVHSVPRFPPYARDSYGYPESGTHYGQTFLCVTYSYKYLNTIGEQLKYNDPQIYDSNLPESFAAENKAIADIVAKKSSCDWPFYSIAQLSSVGSQSFRSFAKCTKFDADLYHDLVATNYKADLYVESWLLGPGKMDSNCSSYKVQNVEYMSFDTAAGVDFKSTRDHAKWAVSPSQQLTCIGDINREVSQKLRSGGTVCFGSPSVWANFKTRITGVQKCP